MQYAAAYQTYDEVHQPAGADMLTLWRNPAMCSDQVMAAPDSPLATSLMVGYIVASVVTQSHRQVRYARIAQIWTPLWPAAACEALTVLTRACARVWNCPP